MGTKTEMKNVGIEIIEDAEQIESIKIYLNCIEEIKSRLLGIDYFLKNTFLNEKITIECSILQLRKVLELILLAAIAPNKTKYKEFRLAADEQKDFRKDYNGRKILEMLKKINPYFYPRPLMQPIINSNGTKHLDAFTGDYLSMKIYASIYDKCGKLLHADNPWDDKKSYKEFWDKIPNIINQIKNLLNLHSIIIMHNKKTICWIIELGDKNNLAKGHIANADGLVFIDNNYYQ